MNKKAQRQAKLSRQQEIVNAAKNAGRDLTAEEQVEFDSLQREIETLNAEIVAEEQNEETGSADSNTDVQRALQEERNRIRTITDICGEFGMDAKPYIDGEATVDAVRAAALDHVRKNGAPIAARGVEVIKTAEDKFREAAADALLLRSGLSLNNPADGSRQMMGMSLRDLAIECLSGDGDGNLNRRTSETVL